jgi:DNA repair protein RadC
MTHIRTGQISEERPINPKKQALILLSQQARDFREKMMREAAEKGNDLEVLHWGGKLVNDIIANWYREQTGAETFKTLKRWNEEGYRVKQGEKAFLLWAKRETVFRKDEEGKQTETEDYRFFPVAYLFSNLQVQPAEVPQMAEEDPATYDGNFPEIELKYKPGTFPRFQVTDSETVFQALKNVINPDTVQLREEFLFLLFNRANICLGWSRLSVGGLTGTAVDGRLIFATALKAGACSVILCHNHPSGNTRPSESDFQITKKLQEAGRILEINILDHIILNGELTGYYSFASEGMMNN